MMPADAYSDIGHWQRDVVVWAAHNFPHDTTELTVLGLVEEAGEVARAVLKRRQNIRGTYPEWTDEIKKECADVFIKLCHVAGVEGFSLANAIVNRWAEVSQRDFIANPKGHGLPE